MENFLNDILEHKRALIKSRAGTYLQLKESVQPLGGLLAGQFKRALSKTGDINVIMELKKASPSKGVIREDFDLQKIARIYADHGAAAFSVLTEDKYFLGKPEYILELSQVFNVPILAKDFIVDEGQIYEARANGASAVLLIARILDYTALKYLLSVVHQLGMDALVEVHEQAELNQALNAGAAIIGVNNRNLETFAVDMKISETLIPQISKAGRIAVAESGIKTHQDIRYLKFLGAHAVLIGETFMVAPDIGEKIREVVGS